MAHFGIISPPVPGHLNPMFALAAALRQRGHSLTFFQMPDLEKKVRDQGFDFVALGRQSHPPGSLEESLRQLSQLRGLRALRFTVQAIRATTEMFCSEGPSAIRAAGIDMLLVDQTEPAGGAVAEHLGRPFITICNALLLNREPDVPPPFTPWMPSRSAFARLRNATGYIASDCILRPVTRVLASYRKKWRLPPISRPDETFSQLAQISQQPSSFEFPRANLPECFRFSGPFRQPEPDGEFPWDGLDGRPLVYASLGTLQNRNFQWFHMFAQACRVLDVQLVISHGYGLTREQAAALSKNALVIPYAPQRKLLSRASLTLTHAGLNTVLDSLSCGVPLLCVPITYEQPAIAARVKWTATGRIISPGSLSEKTLSGAISRILDGEKRQSLTHVQRNIEVSGGAAGAAALIETVLHSGNPLGCVTAPSPGFAN